MPSVEMRRSTRVFVPKAAKDGGFVKILRSGRRLWGDPLIDDNKWDNKGALPGPKPKTKQLEVQCDASKWEEKPKHEEKAKEDEKRVCRREVRVIRNVYTRKRKRGGGDSINSTNSWVFDGDREKRMFGLHFVRRKRSKGVEKVEETVDGGNVVLSVVFEGCFGCSVGYGVLWSLLKHLGSGSVDLTRLFAFLVSGPLVNVFASYGVRFLLNQRGALRRGVCRIFGERERMPLFSLDFSAVPLCFMSLHVTLLLKSLRLSCLSWMNFQCRTENESTFEEAISCTDDLCDRVMLSIPNIPEKDDERTNIVVAENESTYEAPLTSTDGQRDQVMLSIPIAPKKDDKGVTLIVAGLEAGKVASNRTVQYRSGVMTRSSSKRRSRSLRNRRARNPAHLVMQKANGTSVSNNVMFKRNGVQLPIFRDQGVRRSTRKKSSCEISLLKSSLRSGINVLNSTSSSISLNVDVDSQQCCSANVIVVESDKCFRIQGAEVALETSAANEWILAVRKDGMTRYRLNAQKEMRPHTINRFTQAVLWTAEHGWKLEFPNRKDWALFKELYKLCVERNIAPSSPAVKIIPIPGVSEVTDFKGPTSAFERPESYIRMTSDELSRILSRRTANYDMDSEDEEWLSVFNGGLDESDSLSKDTFELMIDAFEKGYYCSLEDVHDEKRAIGHCLDLARAKVTLPVYRYWTEKRKRKGVPLLRVFELNERKKAQSISKPVLRKRRSLKRAAPTQPFSQGRGKDSTIMQAMAVEQTILEEQHSVLRVQEARVSADKLVEVATQKRQRAQFLMDNADLATYRATIALRIADAAALGVDSQQAASHFLD